MPAPPHLLPALALLLAAATSAGAQTPAATDVDPLALLADTTDAAFDAGLRLERARLALARDELRALTPRDRLRPQLDLYLSVSTRGLAFPSLSSQGYDPAYAAIARWPGDAWGLTVSWTLDQLLDRRPLQRARAAVAVAEARVALLHARREAQREHEAARARAQAVRDAERRRRTEAAAALLHAEAAYLDRRLAAERELLRLAELTYEQGETDYAHLARRRLAALAAEHARALATARLDALHAGLAPDDLARLAAPDAPGAPDAPPD